MVTKLTGFWKIGIAVTWIIMVCGVSPLNRYKTCSKCCDVRNLKILSLILGQFESTLWSPHLLPQLTEQDFRGT